MAIIDNISNTTILFLGLATISIVIAIIFLIKKNIQDKQERAWMEDNFDKPTTANQAESTDGKILDNGDFVGVARVVHNIDSGNAIEADEVETMVINQDIEPNTQFQAQFAEHIIGDLATEKPIDEPSPAQLNLSDTELYDSDDLSDNQSYADKFTDPLMENVAEYSDANDLNSPHHTMIALTILAPTNDLFEGADMLRGFVAQELDYHLPTGFYCRVMPGFKNQQLFCVASILEPGMLNPEAMGNFKTKGLLLFMSLPNKVEPSLAFEQMHQAATKLAKDLGGMVCDSQRNQLNDYRLEQMRDDMRELSLKLDLEAKRQE